MAENEELGLDVTVNGVAAALRQLGRMDSAIDGTGKNWLGLGSIWSGSVSVALGNLLSDGIGLAIDLLADMGRALIDVGVDSFNLAADFQGSMVILEQASGNAGLSIDQLHDAVLRVGGDTDLVGVSATGAAASITNLYKAGLTTTEIFGDLNGYLNDTAELGGALRAAIDLAAASELDMEQASELATVALSTFGGELETAEERAEFVNRAMNNFVQAADASVADVADLAAAWKNVAPSAAAMGFTVEDLNNALAIMSTRGIKGAEAGTQLKSMMTNLMRDTPKVKGMLRDLNVQLFDQEGALLPLPNIINQLNTGLAGATEEQRLLAVQTLAGTYGMNAMNTLLGEGAEGWDAMAKATAEASSIQDVAAARSATFRGEQEALEGALETLQITLGERLLPIATEFAQWLSSMVEEHGPAIDAFFGAMVGWVQDTLPIALEWLSGFFGETLPGAIGTASGYWNDVLLPALSNVQAYINENIVPILTVLADWLQMALPVAIGILSDIWENQLLPIGAALLEAWQTNIQPTLSELWSWLQEVVPQAIEYVSEIWETTLLPAMQTITAFLTEYVIPALGTMWGWLFEQLPGAIQLVVDYFNNTWGVALTAVWSFMSEFFLPILSSLWTWLQETLPPALETLRMWWEEKILPALDEVWSFIETDLLPLFETLGEFLGVTLMKTLEILEAFWTNILLPAFKNLWGDISENLMPVLDALKVFFDETLSPILKSFVDDRLDKVRKAFDDIKEAVKFAKATLDGWIESIKNMSIPEWLEPGSPPPLFYALKDIGRAMNELSTRDIPAMNAAFALPTPRIAAVSGLADSGGGGRSINQISQVTENNFNLTSQTVAPQSMVEADFRLMELASR